MIELDGEIVAKCGSYKSVLAYVSVLRLGPGTWTTAQLAGAVNCMTEAMREGMQELCILRPGRVRRESPKSTKWVIGSGVVLSEGVRISESDDDRRKAFVDDLKRYWDHKNPALPFTFGPQEGQAVKVWLRTHKEWTQPMWRQALNNRGKSVVVHSRRLYLWIGRLEEYYETPLNEFGQPMVNGGGKLGQALTTEQGNRAAREQAVAGSHS